MSRVTWYPRSHQDLGEGNGGWEWGYFGYGGHFSLLNVSDIVVVKPVACWVCDIEIIGQ